MAVDFARNVLPVAEKLRSAGTTSVEGIARALNRARRAITAWRAVVCLKRAEPVGA